MPGLLSKNVMQTVARSMDPDGFWYDFKRPSLLNPDGSFSTEETITVEMDGKQVNIPTIWNGQRVSPQQAIAIAMGERAKGRKFPEYNTIDRAEMGGRLRSFNRGLLNLK